MIIGGIDPGFTGAVAVINDYGDCETMDMPVIGEGTQKIINAARLSAFLTERDVEFAVVEALTAMPKWGCVQNFRIGGALHSVLSILQLSCIPYKTVTPAQWKRQMGLSREKHQSRRLATERFPRAYQQFERVKDDGRAESALLALWWLDRRKKEAA